MTQAPAPAAVPAADAHNDLLMLVEHFRDDPGYFRRNWLPQLQAGQVRTQVLPVYVDEEFLPELALRQTLRLIETALATVGSCPELMLCRQPGEVEHALASDRIGIVLALEGCPAIGTDVQLLRTLFRLGVRVASLTHFGRNSLADGSAEDAAGSGLTRAGVADFTREIAEVLYGGGHVIEGCDMAAAVPGLAGPADLPNLAAELARRGFGPADVAAVMGGNLRRLLNEAIGAGLAASP